MISVVEKPDYGYSNFLARNSLCEEDVQHFMHQLPKPVAYEIVDSTFAARPSFIQGRGMFAIRQVKRGETFPMFVEGRRSNLARYVNHKDASNAVAQIINGREMWCIMLVDIEEGEEITMDYNDNKAKSTEAVNS